MKFYDLDQNRVTDALGEMEQDYKAGREIGIVRLGASHLYFRRMRKVYFVPYEAIRRCFRRVMLVPARLCCGKGDLEVENLVLCTDEGEAAQIQLPGAKAGKILLEELKARIPDAEFTPMKSEAGAEG